MPVPHFMAINSIFSKTFHEKTNGGAKVKNIGTYVYSV